MTAELRDVPAPAKINLFLHVVGRRPDGYHLLQTAFRFIDLQDTLHFRARPDGRIVRAYDLPGVPEDADLVVRAARALRQATGCGQGAEIGLEKRIPAGGGLGGGSSDAATVLLALNRLWGTGLSRHELMRLALPLGADVPVFVFGRNAFAEGVGEELTAIDLPQRWYVVVQPDASVPTADVFRAPELTRDTPRVKIADFPRGTFDPYGNSYRNDLENVVFARFSEVGRISAVLAQALGGARVRMSGSGACLFVECDTKAQADGAVDRIAATMQVQPSGLPALRVNLACAGLDAHPLLDWAA
ncbi:4-(cytidine 5'-diphospho)-2-C-methyl-D-erythritol kinase [Pigmentiphaga sp. GD03639]|uniref:4-diphosphocytidyl-2-C-methyl-D-erythritol kinase n=1 Tax=Pigmentiphaga daeguensis TaxID=414049 RepID=A0ABN1CAZ3_9BURK|nr:MULTISPECIES: 4-(cytidine 5'-diphospho)-2-C-methyl-D-erythritol kinase [unclassified Pigmentiphaga]MDH2237488.1 4-(cytidine 5'-diphospho)-2-C-methyl-D-erythritol kinase [Pigmentiphaga sp. GD03639]OVZ63069.1 4-(cytidine 5'-diphospho)-2-C-methyl-D-erythritol kinase [Pigmentiphaga sp. NML030171]